MVVGVVVDCGLAVVDAEVVSFASAEVVTSGFPSVKEAVVDFPSAVSVFSEVSEVLVPGVGSVFSVGVFVVTSSEGSSSCVTPAVVSSVVVSPEKVLSPDVPTSPFPHPPAHPEKAGITVKQRTNKIIAAFRIIFFISNPF